jgi:glycerophosphoryl diester phosphodiesterase
MIQWNLSTGEKPYVIAHRGNSTFCPENTLAAFRTAIKDGADIFETDLHLSRDGEFMCIHDSTVNRTTDGSGQVSAMTLDELRRLNAGIHFSAYQNERIPTLDELMAILPVDAALALELKTDRFLESEVCRRLVDKLDQGCILPRTVFISFSLARIQAVKKAAPDIPIGWITMHKLSPIRGVQFIGPYYPLLFFNPFYVSKAHKLGQWICPLDPEPLARLRFYKWMGCDAILCNDPSKVVQALKRLSPKK